MKYIVLYIIVIMILNNPYICYGHENRIEIIKKNMEIMNFVKHKDIRFENEYELRCVKLLEINKMFEIDYNKVKSKSINDYQQLIYILYNDIYMIINEVKYDEFKMKKKEDIVYDTNKTVDVFIIDKKNKLKYKNNRNNTYE